MESVRISQVWFVRKSAPVLRPNFIPSPFGRLERNRKLLNHWGRRCWCFIIWFLHLWLSSRVLECSTQWRCVLTPYSRIAHLNYLSVASFWGHLVSLHSQDEADELTLWACSKLSVSLQFSQLAHCYHCIVSSLHDITNNSQQACRVSCKFMESLRQVHSVSHLVSLLWGNWVSSKWAYCEFQCEMTVS